MARLLFPTDLILTSPVVPTVLLSANAPFTLWSDRTGGQQYTDCTGPDGFTALLKDASGNFLADASGQLPELRGPDEVTVMWRDTGLGKRYPWIAVDRLQAVLSSGLDAGAVAAVVASMFGGVQGDGVGVTYDAGARQLTVTVAGTGGAGINDQAAGNGTTYSSTKIDSLLGAKANDSAVVKVTGDQAIAGSKTFQSPLTVASPTADSHAATKASAAQAAADAASAVSAAATTAQTAAASAVSLVLRGAQNSLAPITKIIGYFGKAGHGWGISGTGSANDTATPMMGAQSFLLSPQTSGQLVYAAITLGTPISVRNRNVRLTFKITGSTTSIGAITVYLSDTSAQANRVQKNFYSASNHLPGIEYTVDIPLGEFAVTGTAPLDAVGYVRIQVQGGAGAPGSVNIAQIALTNDLSALAPKGVATLSFDDTHLSQYAFARPKMAEYGFAGTLYPTVGRIGLDATTMTLAQMKYMADYHGWDFGAHAIDQAHHTDQSGKTEAYLRDHFEQIIAWMRANDLRGRSYAWPNTTCDDLSRRIAADYFSGTRGGQPLTETLPPVVPHNLRAYNAGNLTLAATKAAIDVASNASGPGWVHLFYHRIAPAVGQTFDVTESDFAATVDYLAASGIRVLTASQALALVGK